MSTERMGPILAIVSYFSSDFYYKNSCDLSIKITRTTCPPIVYCFDLISNSLHSLRTHRSTSFIKDGKTSESESDLSELVQSTFWDRRTWLQLIDVAPLSCGMSGFRSCQRSDGVGRVYRERVQTVMNIAISCTQQIQF